MEIIRTDDGSCTLYRPDIDEHYHSVKGALTESIHVYVECALRHWHTLHPDAHSATLLEVGFGTGLNAALTAQAMTPHKATSDANIPDPTALTEPHMADTEDLHLTYVSYELYPLPPETVEEMGYDLPWLQSIHRAPWDRPTEIHPHFTLHKVNADILRSTLPTDIDIVYFDAFAPEKQEEMWSPTLFAAIHAAMRPGGILTTYCAKGAIRRMLAATGFRVERIPGPPGGKREILRCSKV